MNLCAPSRNRLRRGLLYLARALWMLFAICNLISLPFGMQAYYTQIPASARSAPAVARALHQMQLTATQEAVTFTVIFGFASVVFLVIDRSAHPSLAEQARLSPASFPPSVREAIAIRGERSGSVPSVDDPASRCNLNKKGHVNRLKFLKCSMYDRANFDLLHQRLSGP